MAKLVCNLMMKFLFFIFFRAFAIITAASASRNSELLQSAEQSDGQITMESVLPSSGQIEKSHIPDKPHSIRDNAAWSRLTFLQDFYDACYYLDFQKVSNLIDQLSDFKYFPFEEAIQLAIETAPENINNEALRWNIIDLLYDVAKQNQKNVHLYNIRTNLLSSAKLKNKFESVDFDKDLSDISSGEDESLQDLAKYYDNYAKNVPRISLMQALRNAKSLEEINQTFPELMTSTSFQIQNILIESEISAISQRALMNAVENILPMAEEYIKDPKQSTKQLQSVLLNLLKSPHAEIWEFIENLSAEKKNLLDMTISWMTTRSDQLLMAFKTSTLEMTEYLFEIIKKLSSSVRKISMKCLYKNFGTIASRNKDLRVVPFLYEKILEEMQTSNSLESYQNDLEHSGSMAEVLAEFSRCSIQLYLNHVAVHAREPHELDLRISLINERRQDVFQHLFNGAVGKDPIMCALFERRWGLAVRLFKFLKWQDISISLPDTITLYSFYQGILALPWPLYQKMRQHYKMMTVKEAEIFLICALSRASPNIDRRIIVEILGYPRPLNMVASSVDQSDDEFSAETLKFFDLIHVCITYQLHRNF